MTTTTEYAVTTTLLSVVRYFHPTPYGPATYGHVAFTDRKGRWVRAAVVHYAALNLTFTPGDVYGPQPETIEDLARCEWFCGAVPAVMVDGLPQLPAEV